MIRTGREEDIRRWPGRFFHADSVFRHDESRVAISRSDHEAGRVGLPLLADINLSSARALQIIHHSSISVCLAE